MLTLSDPPQGLLAYAASPDTIPSPLPPLDSREQVPGGAPGVTFPGAWPAASLGSPALALDLIARGITYRPPRARQRPGYFLHGAPVERLVAARVALDVISDAAALLDTNGRPVEAFALRDTLAALRKSSPAEGNLMRHLRTYLPEPSASAVDDFLAAHDSYDRIRRSELGDAYLAAGSPGDLTTTALYARARERWAPPVRLSGVFHFRPARALTAKATVAPRATHAPARGADIAAHALALGVPVDALAALVELHNPKASV